MRYRKARMKARTSSIHCGDSSSPSSKSSGVTFGWKRAYASPSNLNSCPPVGLFGASAPAPGAGGGASGSETFWPIGGGDAEAREESVAPQRF